MTFGFELLGMDIRMALRSLRQARTFTALSILAVALAIGPNLLIASVLSAIVLRPLPLPQSQRLLFVQETNGGNSVTYPDFVALAQRSGRIAQFGIASFDSKILVGAGRTESLQGARISLNYFDVLGVKPRLGRLPTADSRLDSVVISEDLWRERFGGGVNVLNAPFRLDGKAYRILGVVPHSLQDPTPFGLVKRQYWLVIDPHDRSQISRSGFNYTCVARISAGLTESSAITQIQTDLSTIVGARAKLRPKLYAVRAWNAQEAILGPVRPILWTLFGAVTLVLLTACANLTNLNLARNASRRGCLAVRSALGANRRRIAAELMAESLILTAGGTLIGVGAASLGLWLIGPIASQIFSRWDSVALDWRVLLYAAALIPFVTVIVGLLPALIKRRDIWSDLKDAKIAGERRRTSRFRSMLAVSEIALATALVLTATLVLQSFFALTQVTLGFNSRNVQLVVAPTLSGTRYATEAAQVNWSHRIMNELRAVPGIANLTTALQVPFECCSSVGFSIPGHATAGTEALYDPVGPGYFQSLGIPIRRGRGFGPSDRSGGRPVAIVDEPFARQYFPGQSMLGKRLDISNGRPGHVVTIIGVVGGTREDFAVPERPIVYVPFDQDPKLQYFVFHTTGTAQTVTNEVGNVFEHVDPSLPSPSLTTYSDLFAQHTISTRTNLLLFGTLAAIALLLALTGVYAVTKYSVEQRSREFGMRKALGASKADVFRGVLTGALLSGSIGVVAGLALADVFAKLIDQMLYNASTFDLSVMIIVAVAMIFVVIVAALTPAMRAMSVNPAEALRNE